jgi:hypothetical protein
MPGIRTRLERLERATAEVRCVWLYVGWGGRPGVEGAGDGVSRVFVPTLPPALPPGLLAVLRHPGGAEVSAAETAWALTQLALSPRQRALSAAARCLVLITAGGPGPPPPAAAAGVAPPEAEVGPPPAAERPPPPAAERPLPPPAMPPPPATQWPEWLPR